nr:cytochrome aa3 quinol oxidase subunit II [Bacillus licheniformis]
MFRAFKPLIMLTLLSSVFLLVSTAVKSRYWILKDRLLREQRDLILLSIGFMLFIVAVVFVLFTVMIVKYRERKDRKSPYSPEVEGNTFLEIVWTVVPILIVIALSVPTVQTIYSLEEAPKASKDKEPLVVYATSVDWKWVFSYPEQDIETVNYLNIPTDRPILFKISSADSMASLWIPHDLAGKNTPCPEWKWSNIYRQTMRVLIKAEMQTSQAKVLQNKSLMSMRYLKASLMTG